MWHTILDWLAVVSGVVALLHFFFPKHGARMGDYLLNTFAERSKAKTEERIQKLQARLGHIEVLDILTDFQTILLHGISGILLTLMLIPALLLLAYIVAFNGEPPLSLIPRDMYRDSILLLLFTLHVTVVTGVQRGIQIFRIEHSSKYRTDLRNDMDILQKRLNRSR